MKRFNGKDKKAADECYVEVAEKFQNSTVAGKSNFTYYQIFV